MQTSSPTSPKPPQPKSILLIGPPGGGKTTLLMQFPGLCIIDCDGNLDGPENYVRKRVNKDLAYAYDTPNFIGTSEVPVEKRYERLIALLREARGGAYTTIAIDGLTMINEYIIRKVLHDNKQEAMRPIDWQPLKSLYWNLIVSGIRSLGKDTIVTCHEVIMTKNDPKTLMVEQVIGYRPSVQGGIADYFGGFFTDVLRCSCAPAPGDKVEYKLETVRNTLSDLKNSIGLPAVIMNPSYKILEPYLKGEK